MLSRRNKTVEYAVQASTPAQPAVNGKLWQEAANAHLMAQLHVGGTIMHRSFGEGKILSIRDDILTAVRIAKEFGLRATLDHCTDGVLIADELAEENFPVFIGPSLGHKSKIELANKSFTTPGILNRAGLCVSIITDAPVIPLQYLPMCAGLAVNSGLDKTEAWKAITINPARSLGIEDRVGSLEVGKDADVVIWTADPLSSIGGEAEVTIIDGQVVYRRA